MASRSRTAPLRHAARVPAPPQRRHVRQRCAAADARDVGVADDAEPGDGRGGQREGDQRSRAKDFFGVLHGAAGGGLGDGRQPAPSASTPRSFSRASTRVLRTVFDAALPLMRKMAARATTDGYNPAHALAAQEQRGATARSRPTSTSSCECPAAATSTSTSTSTYPPPPSGRARAHCAPMLSVNRRTRARRSTTSACRASDGRSSNCSSKESRARRWRRTRRGRRRCTSC